MTRWTRAVGVSAVIAAGGVVGMVHADMPQPSAAAIPTSSTAHIRQPAHPSCNTYTPDGVLGPHVPARYVVIWELPGTYQPITADACKTFGSVTPPCTAPTFDQCIIKPAP